jgi:hypothetical protein
LRALILIVALLVSGVAQANNSVGLIVTGDVLKTPTQMQAEKWLRDHDRKVVTNALTADALKTLLDCFVIDDAKCSRSLVDTRATTESLVMIRIDIVSKKDKDVRLSMDWFVKGRNPVSARRTCEDCTEAILRTTIDSMLLDLAKTSPGFMGRIKVTSEPAGISVLLDNETIGVTPLERDVSTGPHKTRLVRDGRMGAEKDVKIEAGALLELKLDAPPTGGIIDDGSGGVPRRRSRVPAIVTMGLGAATIGTGSFLAFVKHKDLPANDFDTKHYTDYKTPGYITMGAGGVIVIAGAIWFFATGSSSSPTVGVTSTGDATIGWTGRF